MSLFIFFSNLLNMFQDRAVLSIKMTGHFAVDLLSRDIPSVGVYYDSTGAVTYASMIFWGLSGVDPTYGNDLAITCGHSAIQCYGVLLKNAFRICGVKILLIIILSYFKIASSVNFNLSDCDFKALIVDLSVIAC